MHFKARELYKFEKVKSFKDKVKCKCRCLKCINKFLAIRNIPCNFRNTFYRLNPCLILCKLTSYNFH